MDSELLAVGAAFAGVAMGFVGSLAAASIQRKGSQAQADATAQSAVTTAEAVYQAAVTTSESGYRAAVTAAETAYQAAIASSESQYRAALTTAKTQYASALEALNRTARRAAYVSFITAAAALRRGAESAIEGADGRAGEDSDVDLGNLTEALRALQATHGAVELEGPPAVLPAAAAALNRAQRLAAELTRHIQHPRAERALTAACSFLGTAEGSPERQAAVRASRALSDLRALPASDEVRGAEREAERDRLMQRAREAVYAVTSLSRPHGRLLLWWAAERPEGFSRFMQQQLDDFAEASATFVHAARTCLNDTQPDMSEAG
ncbi:hypothetical protein ACFZB4_42865 [Streptomyces pseudovenezuelae]|uniref:hypothetical protein n=2 Tax=Streptomyces pseudovenezuelae TaxID=67350 RepID=UPI0036EF2341